MGSIETPGDLSYTMENSSMTKKTPTQTIIDVLSSIKFFRATVALLIISAAWIALSARYPMAFDEDFHLGIIRLYAEHGLPFWQAQPSGGDAYGAVARDPSYLFHYLMSFPYRFIALFTDNQTVQVILLRFINIGLFASCLPLYRRLLLKTGASNALVHTCMALFVLVPIVPFLAAQINYDNLILPLAALTLLLTIRIDEYLGKNRLGLTPILQYLVVGVFACLVKYAFLPIFLATTLFLVVRLCLVFGRPGKVIAALKVLKPSLVSNGNRGLLILLLLLSILAFERYGLNVIRYHDPVPDCAAVLSIEQCSAYGPWIRDYDFADNKGDFTPDHSFYAYAWLRGMWLRSFFTLAGPTNNFETRGPLIMPAISGVVLAAASLLLFCRYTRRLLGRDDPNRVSQLFLVTAVMYICILVLEGFRLYVHSGLPVALNGRYLLPILPIVFVLAGLAFRQLLWNTPSVKAVMAVVVLVCFLWGGGALTFILRSNDSWYFPSGLVRSANHAVQRTVGPITPGYNHPTIFLPY